MATHDAPQSFRKPAQGAIMLDCLDCVSRAGGVETTRRREYRGQQVLVATDTNNEQLGNLPESADRIHSLDRFRTEQADHSLINVAWGIKRKIRSHGDHDIGMSRINVPTQSKRLFENSLDSIPDNRSFQLSADTDANPVVATFIGQKNHAKIAAIQPFSMPVDCIEFPVLP
jgi:hypothetical protein